MFEFIKDNKLLCGIVLPIVAIGALGGIHHGVYHVVNNWQEKNDKVAIERNIEDSADFSKYSCNAVLATKKDGKYYVEIFGTGVKETGKTPEFCSVSYEIGKDLYETIYKYYDISYEYGRDGQVVNATNRLRTDLGALGNAKAKRANWKSVEELVEVTKNEPVFVTMHNNNDTDSEKE